MAEGGGTYKTYSGDHSPKLAREDENKAEVSPRGSCMAIFSKIQLFLDLLASVATHSYKNKLLAEAAFLIVARSPPAAAAFDGERYVACWPLLRRRGEVRSCSKPA